MKLIKNCGLILLSIFLFTGCFNIEPEIKEQYIEGNVKKDLNKINEEIYFKKNDKKIVSQRPDGIKAKTFTLNPDLGSLNNFIGQSYFKQYFNNVGLTEEKKNTGIYIDSYIKSYNFVYLLGYSIELKTVIHVDAYYKGELLVSKDYNSERNVYGMLVNTFSDADLFTLFSEALHESVLNVYKNDFQKDFLTSLKAKVEPR